MEQLLQKKFLDYKSGIGCDEMNGFVTKWLGEERNKIVEIEVKGQVIIHDF